MRYNAITVNNYELMRICNFHFDSLINFVCHSHPSSNMDADSPNPSLSTYPSLITYYSLLLIVQCLKIIHSFIHSHTHA
eukprot:m.130807 g.130807  ORF g.130807 m.130807 type:complete len:79 (-) comp9473_c0_seq5:3267-3503(-)